MLQYSDHNINFRNKFHVKYILLRYKVRKGHWLTDMHYEIPSESDFH